jgi:hypothetical protein
MSKVVLDFPIIAIEVQKRPVNRAIPAIPNSKIEAPESLAIKGLNNF